MAGRTINYWRTQWDHHHALQRSRLEEIKDADTALELLAQYAAFFRNLPIIGLAVAWGGGMGRFFSGRWNTHHGNVVQRAIANYFHMDGLHANEDNYHKVRVVLAFLKQELGDTPLNLNGDFARIMQIIQEKTGIDFNAMTLENAQQVIQEADEKSGIAPRL